MKAISFSVGGAYTIFHINLKTSKHASSNIFPLGCISLVLLSIYLCSRLIENRDDHVFFPIRWSLDVILEEPSDRTRERAKRQACKIQIDRSYYYSVGEQSQSDHAWC
jgi:hypothetical protein